MAIHLSWLVPERVISGEYVDEIDMPQVTQAMRDIRDMMDTSSAPLVHALADTSRMKTFPTNIVQLHQATRDLLTHPRYGWLIIYGRDDAMLRFVLQMLSGMFKVRLRMFIERDDALHFLNSMDTTLPDLRAEEI